MLKTIFWSLILLAISATNIAQSVQYDNQTHFTVFTEHYPPVEQAKQAYEDYLILRQIKHTIKVDHGQIMIDIYSREFYPGRLCAFKGSFYIRYIIDHTKEGKRRHIYSCNNI